MKNIVVSIQRDRWFQPKLKIIEHTRARNEKDAQRFIDAQILASYARRSRRKFGSYSMMRVTEFRIVDELGLKRLHAAAKASATLRRRRGAKKAAATRARRRELASKVK